MLKKPIEMIYKKILKDISRYDSDSSMVNYKDSNGIETETTFRVPPSPDEFILIEQFGGPNIKQEELLLIYLFDVS